MCCWLVQPPGTIYNKKQLHRVCITIRFPSHLNDAYDIMLMLMVILQLQNFLAVKMYCYGQNLAASDDIWRVFPPLTPPLCTFMIDVANIHVFTWCNGQDTFNLKRFCRHCANCTVTSNTASTWLHVTYFNRCNIIIIVIIIIISALTIVKEDQWGDLECLHKAWSKMIFVNIQYPFDGASASNTSTPSSGFSCFVLYIK